MNFIKRHKILSTVAVVMVIGIIWYASRGAESPFVIEEVERGAVELIVSNTGRVVPADDVRLSFERGGSVEAINVRVGSFVYAGQELARISSGELRAQLTEAEASLSAQEAKLSESLGGTRPEEIAIAETDLKNAYLPVADIINDAGLKMDDALYKQLDPMFDNDDTGPQLNFNIRDTQLENNAETGRLVILESLNGLKTDNDKVNGANQAELDNILDNAKSRLLKFDSFFSVMLQVVNSSVALSDSTVSTYKANVNTARTNTQTALNAITAQQKVIASAKKNLSLKQAGSTPEAIAYQKAQVEVAKAGVDKIKSQIEGTIIVSPINGVITERSVNPGEFVSAGASALKVISSGRLQVEANVPEVDVAKLKVNQEAEITLDAYGSDEMFKARVVKIDPAEVIIDGVSTYKVTFIFINKDERIKSGMTANIETLAQKKEEVIRVPQRAVIKEESRTYVRLPKDTTESEEREVILGLRGSDGFYEVMGGLSEGEEVIVFEKSL